MIGCLEPRWCGPAVGERPRWARPEEDQERSGTSDESGAHAGGVPEMTVFVQFAVLGLGIGAVYTLLAQGIVLVYRGSGVVNFAQATFAMAGAYVFYELRSDIGVVPAILGAIIGGCALGAVVQNAVMRPLRNAAPVVRIMATLGVFIILQAIGVLHYGDSDTIVDPFLPQSIVHFFGLYVAADRLILF